MTEFVSETECPFAVRATFWTRLDEWTERAGEKLNPILVKESRQALKSKQFLVTFTLLLICGLGWSLIGVALVGPGVYYAPTGPYMLIGYHIVLTVPLLLIVPFAAYRSLAAEREDGTYELLSITTLSSRQIVSGKLGSAVLQMMIYYSALAPCIAFTYLLRGVDVFTIGLVLFYTFAASLLLSAFGLVVAAITRLRHLQLLLSVALLLGLVVATLTWCISMGEIAFEMGALPYDEPGFWIAQAAIVTALASYFILFVWTAGAQLSFASDNRSTRLRVVMLAQQVLFTGWLMYYWLSEREPEILIVWLGFSGGHWMVMGSLLTGELAPLSPRVKRRLPQSFLARAFLTWFNPGSGTGYVFAVANLAAVVLVAVAAVIVADMLGNMPGRLLTETSLFAVLLLGYLAAYLGVGRLLVLWLRRYLYFGLLLPFLVDVLLALGGAAIPTLLQAWLFGLNGFRDYSVLQVTNWFWTLGIAVDNPTLLTFGVPVLVGGFAAVVFAINLLVARQEVEQVRQELPERVREDERVLHPERLPVRPVSPWDE